MGLKFVVASFFLLILFGGVPVSALSIVAHVPEKYTDVVSGERFYFEVEVKYPENSKRKDLRMEYKILNEDGDVVAQSKVLKAIETQASFIDFIVIPESADTGIHFIKISVSDYESLYEEVEASFFVVSGVSDFMIYFLILLGAIFLVGVAVVVLILKRR